MTPTKSKVEQVENLLKAINQPYATYEQVATLTKALISSVKTLKESIKADNLSDKTALLAQVDSIVAGVVDNYNSAVKEIKKAEKESKKRTDKLEEDLRRLIKETEAKIPDTTYLMLKVDELENKEIEEYDDSALIEGMEEIDIRIEELQDEIDRLKKKSTTQGGGGSGILNIGHWPRHEAFTMNGSDTTVTLSQAVAANGTALIVRYQGQTLDLTTHYTVDGNKITLVGFTPEVDTIISVTFWT